MWVWDTYHLYGSPSLACSPARLTFTDRALWEGLGEAAEQKREAKESREVKLYQGRRNTCPGASEQVKERVPRAPPGGTREVLPSSWSTRSLGQGLVWKPLPHPGATSRAQTGRLKTPDAAVRPPPELPLGYCLCTLQSRQLISASLSGSIVLVT